MVNIPCNSQLTLAINCVCRGMGSQEGSEGGSGKGGKGGKEGKGGKGGKGSEGGKGRDNPVGTPSGAGNKKLQHGIKSVFFTVFNVS